MKKVFFIGKFNTFYEEMNQFLSGYFDMQVCIDNASLIKGMLKLNHPDIIIISLLELEVQKAAILTELKELYPNIPKLCMGTGECMTRFQDVFSVGGFYTFEVPGEKKMLIEEIYKVLQIDYSVNSSIMSRNKGDRKCILLIDDSPMQLRVLNEILKKDYDVQMATSAAKALTLLGQRLPDIIFLDYDMPECDGRMTLQMIREVEEAKDIPVIFLTGVNDGAHIRAVLELHPAGYMLKPANREKLYEVLDKFLK